MAASGKMPGEESPNSAGQGASEEEGFPPFFVDGRRQVQQKVNIQSAVWQIGNR